jgi:flagellar assembly factor FliW
MTSSPVDEKCGTIETRFGRFALGPGDVVAMVEPLAGFETCRQYVLLSPPEIAPLVCLQGLDGARPSFLAVAAHLADPSFSCAPTPADWDRLGFSGNPGPEGPPLWLALVHVGPDEASANLRAPVVINPARMVGLQLVPQTSPYSTEHPLPLG